jgi:tetratricopeptide (TPR) repeat protein
MEEVEVLSGTERFVREHSKKLVWILGGVVLVAGVWIGISTMYVGPREQAASEALYKAEAKFRRDSFRLALEEFGWIAEKYGSTRSGKLSKGYAGVCAYREGDYAGALKWLEGFGGSGDAYFGAVVLGLQGDCYANLGESKKAAKLFEEASKETEDATLGAVYLKKAGIAWESIGEWEKAVKAYRRLKSKYGESQEAGDIDKYITKAELCREKQKAGK